MNDKIFLLSVDEYEKYYDRIPKYDAEGKDYSWCWWLRTPYKCASSSSRAFLVGGDRGGVGSSLVGRSYAVRPALDISEFTDLEITNCRFTRLSAEWQVIDDNLAIAVEPIFNSIFDEETDDYEKSEVRKKLLEWYELKTAEGEYKPYIELGDGKYDFNRIRELDDQELAETLTNIYKAGIDEGIIIGERSDEV